MVSDGADAAVGPSPPDRRPHPYVVAAIVTGLVIFVLLLLDVVHHGRISSFDDTVAGAMNRHNVDDGGSRCVALVVTPFGSTLVLGTVAIVATVALAVRGRRRHARFLIVTAVVGTSLNNLVKMLVGRGRPHFEQAITAAYGNSFPSGHSMNSTVVYGAILLVVWPLLAPSRHRMAAVVTTVAVAGIAVSRVVLTVHYVSDVVAGISLGVVVLGASAWAFGVAFDDELRGIASP